ncbi:MAG: efflux RND transporter periplasmic adaptor subunit [Myxococcota bacterium]
MTRALLIVLLLGSGCARPEEARSRAARVVPVETAPVIRGSLALTRSLTGAIEAAEDRVVSADRPGRVRHVAYDLGEQVAPGSVLVTLDDRDSQVRLRAARASLSVTRARARQSARRRDLARRERERIEALQAEGVSSSADLDAAATAEAEAAAAAEVAEAEVARARAELGAAELERDRTVLRAREGTRWVVAARTVDPGVLIEAGQPLLTLIALDPLQATVFVSEADHARVKPGQAVTLRVEALGGDRPHPGRVARVAPRFEPGSRQARVELEIDNPSLELKPGMFARVEIALGELQDALIVPQDALTKRREVQGVFQVDGDEARWIPVELGATSSPLVQILSPALEGRVVTLGQNLLEDGTQIRPLSPAAP